MKRPLLPMLGVAVLLAGGTVAAQATRSDAVSRATPAATAASVPLASAALTCPAPSATGSTSSLVTAVSPDPTAKAARGQLSVVQLLGHNRLVGDPLSGGGRAEVVKRRGELLHAEVPTRTGPVVARATGALAPGAAAGQFSRSVTGPRRGISLAECTPARAESWFVGGGSGVGRTTTLYLSNPDPSPALVDVTAWGPEGQLSSRSLLSLSVGPSSQRVIRLDAEIPAARYGLRVLARQGRVAAAVQDSQVEGLQPLGVDWVGASVAPSRRLVVPGVLPGSGSRTLQILAPGSTGAVVQVAVLGASGTTAPDALAAIAVDAGTVADVDISALAAAAPTGLVLSSDVPVTASVLMRQGAEPGIGTDPGDLAYVAASTPVAVGDSAVLPYVATGVGRFAEVFLTAPGRAARVRLVPLERPGRPGPAPLDVVVPDRSTLRVALDTAVGTYASGVLVQVEGGGQVWAAGSLREAGADGPLLTALSLHAQPRTVRVPAVVSDPRAG